METSTQHVKPATQLATGISPLAIVVMGVAGSGKTTIGRLLADSLHCPFLDADDFHSQESKDKMSLGVPLSDATRLPWLLRVGEATRATAERVLREIAEKEAKVGGGSIGVVLACSALKPSYRDVLREKVGGRRGWLVGERGRGDGVSSLGGKEGRSKRRGEGPGGSEQKSLALGSVDESMVSRDLGDVKEWRKESGIRIMFVHLKGSREVLYKRMEDRMASSSHFMPPSLLESQLDTLSFSEHEDDVVHIDASLQPDQLVQIIQTKMKEW